MSLFFHLSITSLVPFLIPLLLLVSFKWLLSFFKTPKNLPPSPRKLPIIGNLHQLGSTPHRTFKEFSEKLGPLVLLRLGSIPVIVANTAETTREILKTHDLTFSNKPILTVNNILTYGSKDIAFAPYGEHWRQMKSIAVLQLLSNARVKSFQKVREEEMTHMLNKIRESGGSVVNLSVLLSSFTNNTVSRVALGRTFPGLKFKGMMTRFIQALGSFCIGNFIPWLSFVDRLNGIERKAKEVAKEFDEFLESVVKEHENRRRQTNGASNESQDLVDFLLDAQKENTNDFTFDRDTIKAIIMDMFIAGTDTTSNSMEWAISETIKNPTVMKKVQQEVEEIAQGRSMITYDDLEKLHYLNAVIKESFRIHPPGALLSDRESTQDIKLLGYDIPAGTRAMINVWAIQKDPSLWEEPETFNPERFLNSPIDYKGLHFELLPFGAGRRGCPGIQFATAIERLVIANLVHNFDLALPDGRPVEELDMTAADSISVRRESPLLLVATPRF